MRYSFAATGVLAKAQVKRQRWSVVNTPAACDCKFFTAEYIKLAKPAQNKHIRVNCCSLP
jgi:hypothetical protein